MGVPTGDSSKPRWEIFSPFEWIVAIRYLRARRKKNFISVASLLSLAGIAVGVAALIIVMSAMNGLQEHQIATILGIDGHITVRGEHGKVGNYSALTTRLKSYPGVASAMPIIDGEVMASHGDLSTMAQVRGIRRSDLADLPEIASTLFPNDLGRFEGDDAVIIGSGLARMLGLKTGDSIALITVRSDSTNLDHAAIEKSYRVISESHFKDTPYTEDLLFMPLAEAQNFFGYAGFVTSVMLTIEQRDQSGRIKSAIVANSGSAVRAETWQESNSTLYEALRVEHSAMFLILFLIVLVAILNVVSGLIMLVAEKTADIAILRTLGATRGAILRIFFIAGSSVGIAGTGIGLVAGLVVCFYVDNIQRALSGVQASGLLGPTVNFLSRVPVIVDGHEIVFITLLALFCSFSAPLYPAWRAASLDPVKGLKFE